MQCKDLKRVVLNEGLERLVEEDGYYDENGAYTQYRGTFCESWPEEIVLPSTLKEIRGPVFNGCVSLKIAWVGDGCTADIRNSIGESVKIRPKKDVLLGDYFIWDLPKLKQIVIPDGI